MDEPAQQRIFEDWLSRHRGLLFKVVRAYAFTLHDQEEKRRIAKRFEPHRRELEALRRKLNDPQR